jgi:N-acetylmuramoyl-L-alanine amidase
VDLLGRLGWRVSTDSLGASLAGPQGIEVRFAVGSPYFRWNDRPLQMADPAYFDRGSFRVPAQFLADFLPRRLPDLFTFDGPAMVLRYAGRAGSAQAAPAPGEDAPAPAPAAAPPPASEPAAPRSGDEGTRVVIIDAGHGGNDPGSIGKGGLREKTVTLGVARALARDLDTIPGLEVHLLRDSDVYIAPWDRGQIATRLKGDRPGIFISVHANAFNSPARGFETYFLSDARTEHERRVAAIENASLGEEGSSVKPGGDLDFILRDMKNLDTQHWSALLAEMVQERMDVVHPGPNRGVKQAPLAVLTNALMPAVLVEVGYVSHPEEARLLARPSFQGELGEAIAEAVARFFERYPPGTGGLAGAGR